MIRINESRVDWVLNVLEDFGVKTNSQILLLGLSYKPQTDDLRGSPSTRLLQALIEKGYRVYVYDPYVHYVAQNVKGNLAKMIRSRRYLKEILRKTDAVVIATEHEYFYDILLANINNIPSSTLIVDARRLLVRAKRVLDSVRIRYVTVGRYTKNKSV